MHALPSSHGAVLGTLAQPPWGSHVSVVHGLPSSHGLGLSGLHTPAAQVSPVVQALLSSQAAVLGVNVQPVAGLQASSVHGLPSMHVSLSAKPHAPP